MASPVVSIVTPTRGRDELLQRQLRFVLAQSEQEFEWLILDDSAEPSKFFLNLKNPRVRYHHHNGCRMTIGAKRNWLAENSRSDVIAHFDDDDYYAPEYLRTMLQTLLRSGADIVKFSGWFVYNIFNHQLGYWNTAFTRGLHFCFSPCLPIRSVMFDEVQSKAFETQFAGFGFTLVYLKSVWLAASFPEVSFNEDCSFVVAAMEGGFRLEHSSDTRCLCMQIMRLEGISMAYPQFVLPDFTLARLFPASVADLLH